MPKTPGIKCEDLLTEEGAVHILDVTRKWMRDNYTVTELENAEANTEQEQTDPDAKVWETHKNDPGFLVGFLYGTICHQWVANEAAVFGLVPLEVMIKIVPLVGMKTAKQAISVHMNKGLKND